MLTRLIYTALILITFFTLFLGLESRPVELWDEATNIAVVNDSLANNPLILSKDGAPFFEKPPLWHYLTMVIVSLGGQNNVSYRLISVLSAIGILAVTYLWSKQLKAKRFGIITWAILLLSPMLWWPNYSGYFSSHTFKSADLDALQIFFIVAACYFLYLFLQKKEKRDFYISNALLALGFLTKGPLVLPFFLLNSFLAFRAGIKIRPSIIGITIFCLISSSWYLVSLMLFGSSFWDNAVNYHVFSRFASPLEGHVEPPLFYLQIFFDFKMNPFWPLLPVSIYFALKRNNFWGIYFGVITISLLLILSLAQTKLAWYLLPVFVFSALTIASLVVKQKNTLR